MENAHLANTVVVGLEYIVVDEPRNVSQMIFLGCNKEPFFISIFERNSLLLWLLNVTTEFPKSSYKKCVHLSTIEFFCHGLV